MLKLVKSSFIFRNCNVQHLSTIVKPENRLINVNGNSYETDEWSNITGKENYWNLLNNIF